MVAALDGWQLATCIIVGALVLGLILILVIMREGRSRKVRVGMFVEREYMPEDSPVSSDEADTHEWPVRKE